MNAPDEPATAPPDEQQHSNDARPGPLDEAPHETSRSRFLDACAQRRVSRPPVWLYGAAGPYLPEYRELVSRHGIDAVLAQPDLAAEAATQPHARFELDAVMTLGDGSLVAEGLGLPCARATDGTIRFPLHVESDAHVDSLDPRSLRERFAAIPAAQRRLRERIGHGTALLGFATTPFSLAAMMVEGSRPAHHTRIKEMFFRRRELYDRLADLLTNAMIKAIRMQIEAGVDAIFIDDPSAHTLDARSYWYASAQWIQKVVTAIGEGTPLILYARGAEHRHADLLRTHAPVLAADASLPIARFHDELGGVRAVQGNLDPEFLTLSPDIVRDETRRILDDVGRRPGFLFNLASEVHRDAKIECVEALVQTVRDRQA